MTNLASDQINQIRTLTEQAKEILILIPPGPNLDQVAALLSLYLSLISRGKHVSITCPTLMTVEFNHLVGVDKVGNKIDSAQGNNLVISFPYQEGSIEKVSYNIENNAFNLVIEPRKDYPPVTPEAIKYSYTGGNIDLVCTVGVARLSDLDNLSPNQALFNEKPIINIDVNPQNQNYGKVNLVDSNISSICELLVSSFSLLGFNMDNDIATNLLMGITNGTNNFTSVQTTASTFEAAAICLRHGAGKVSSISAKKQPLYSNLPQISSRTPTNINIPQASPMTASPVRQTIQPSFIRSAPKIKIFSPKPVTATVPNKPTHDAPPDWLKPKIYKGSTLL